MATISDIVSESLSEYLILTNWIRCKPEQVSLEASLGPISLEYPYMTARMQSVVGPEMAVAAGRAGILPMIPRSLRDEDKQAILDANNKARLKKGDIEFQENPEYANPDATLEEVIKKVDRVGHSVIPIMDRFSNLLGVYIYNPEERLLAPAHTPITEVMLPLRKNSRVGVPYLTNNEDAGKIKQILSKEEKKFLPILNEEGVLKKIAFLQDYNTNFIGLSISTREGWKRELEKFGSQVDALTIDSSNACFDDAIKILKYVKESEEFKDKPFGIGNIIMGRDFKIFAEAGADYIIGGMGVGSICKTGSKRGNGRGQMTVVVELSKARDEFAKKGKYVYLVLDGGIETVKDMTVALAFADLIMMGNYFNRFYEAAGQKFNEQKNPTSTEELIRYVESWGEGHHRARQVAMNGISFRRGLAVDNSATRQEISERYGHSTISGSTEEGVLGDAEYRGRLKPNVETDARYIRTTISNAGACNLNEFRKEAVLERASQQTLRDMLPHDIKITEE